MKRMILSISIVFSLILPACGMNILASKTNSDKQTGESEIIADINTYETEVKAENFENNIEQMAVDNTMIPIKLQIGENSYIAKLYNNLATNSFIEQLPLTLDMSELNGNEKYGYLPSSLPTDTESIGSIHTGDLMLYGADCMVLFYQNFQTAYGYTRLGYLEDAAGLTSALGQSNIQVSFAVNE